MFSCGKSRTALRARINYYLLIALSDLLALRAGNDITGWNVANAISLVSSIASCARPSLAL